MLTAMEYQREEKNEKGKKRKKKRKSDVQIVASISMVEENENPKTRWEELAGFVSRWKAPGLKTLGRISTSSQTFSRLTYLIFVPFGTPPNYSTL